MSSDSVEVEITVDAADAIQAIEDYQAALEGLEKSGNIDLGKVVDALESSGDAADKAVGPLEDYTSAAEGLADAADKPIGALDDMNKTLENTNTTLSDGQSTLDDYTKTIESAGSGVEGFTTTTEGGAKSIETFTTSTETGTAAITDFTSGTETAGGAVETLANGVGPLAGVIEDTSASITTLNGGLEETSSTVSSTTGEIDSATSALTTYGQGFDTLESSVSAAATPIGELSGTLTDVGGAFAQAGTSSTDFGSSISILNDGITPLAGGLTETTTLAENMATGMGEAGASSESLGASTADLAGNITALGGTIGTGVSLMFRMQDAQLRLDRANLAAAKSTETARKAQLAFDDLLKKAPTNIAGIATALEDYKTALDELNQLQDAGVTTGEAYEKASQALDAAVAALREQFAAGGGDVKAFDSALAKSTNSVSAAELKVRNAEKAQRAFNMTMLETPFAIAGFAGTIIQSAGNLDQMKSSLLGVTGSVKGLVFALGGLGFALAGLNELIVLSKALPIAFEFFDAGSIEDQITLAKRFREEIRGSLIESWKGPELDAQIKQLEKLKTSYENLGIPLPKVGKETSNLSKSQADATGGTKTLNDALGVQADVLDLNAEQIPAVADAISKNSVAQNKLEGSTDAVSASTAKLTTIFDENGKVLARVEGPVNSVQTSYITLEQAMADGKITASEQAAVFDGLTATHQRQASAAALSSSSTSALSQVMGALGQTAGGVVSDYERWNTALGENKSGVTGATAEYARAAEISGMLNGQVINLANGYSMVNGAIVKTTPEMLKVGTAADTSAQAMAKANVATQAMAVAAKNAENEYGFWTDAAIENNRVQAEAEAIMKKNQAALSENIQKYREETQALNDQIQAYGINTDSLTLNLEQRERLVAALDATLGAIDKQVAAQETETLMWSLITADMAKNYAEKTRQVAVSELLNSAIFNTNKALLEQAAAWADGVSKGIAFASAVATAASELDGYRFALEAAINGQTGWSESMGLTIGQLERIISFTKDVAAAQEEIIDAGAQLVDAQVVQIEAWKTMEQAQLNNINTTNQQRVALLSLNNPLTDTAANIQKINEAFISGGEAANAYALGLRETSAETDGYRAQVKSLAESQGVFIDVTGQTVDQLNRLMDALSQTAEGTRRVQESMLAASDAFMGMLKFDPEELRTNVSDAFEEVPGWIQDTMSEGLQEGIVRQGDITRLSDQFVTNAGAAIVGAFRTADPFGEIGRFATESLQTMFNDLDPAVRAGMSGVIAAFQELEALEGADVTADSLGRLNLAFVKLQTAAEQARSPFPPLVDEMNKVATITPEMASGMVQLDGGLANLAKQGQSAALTLGQVGQSAAAGEVPIVKLTDAASGAVTTFANVNGQLVPVQTGLTNLVGPAQLAGNALLGVGTFANAAVIRLGDVMEAFNNLILTLGPHVTTMNTYFTVTIPTALMATQNAFVAFSTMFINTFALMITTLAAHVTTLNTYFLTTIPMAFMASQNAMVSFTTMFVANFATLIAALGQHVTTMTTYFTTTIPTALMASQNAMVQFTSMFAQNMATLISTLGAHVTTINTYFATTIPAAMQTFATAVTTAMNTASTSALTFRNNMQQTQTDAVAALTAIGTAATTMATKVTTGMNSASTAALTFRNNMEQVSDDVVSALAAMETKASSVSSSIVSSFGRIGSAASSAASEVDNLRSSIDSLKDKTVTITTQYRTVGKPAGAQHGFSGVVDHRQNLTVGEYGKPELVSVIPLTNPNVISDKTINVGRLAGAKSTISASGPSIGMQRGGTVIAGGGSDLGPLLAEVRKLRESIGDITVRSTTVLDGKIIDQNIQQRRMRRTENFG